MTKIINSLKISLLIVGAIIGAGFITGREIMRFFYGSNPIFSFIVVFVLFFALIFFFFSVKSKVLLDIISKGSVLIYFFNVLIMASMLGATDSLAKSLFNIDEKLPVFSILLLLLSTAVTFGGIEKVEVVSVVLVPFMLFIFFLSIFSVENKQLNLAYGDYSVVNKIGYVTMNVFLCQPFLQKVKKEKEKFSPFLVAIISAIILSLAIFALISVLSKECISCDIPLILLINGNKYLIFLLSVVIIASIFTTLVSLQYSYLIKINEKSNYLIIIAVSVIAFIISRMGFFVIVDKIYPIIAKISAFYYAFIIAISLIISLKEQRKHTLAQPRHTKSRYSSLQGRVLKPAHRKR